MYCSVQGKENMRQAVECLDHLSWSDVGELILGTQHDYGKGRQTELG